MVSFRAHRLCRALSARAELQSEIALEVKRRDRALFVRHMEPLKLECKAHVKEGEVPAILAKIKATSTSAIALSERGALFQFDYPAQDLDHQIHSMCVCC